MIVRPPQNGFCNLFQNKANKISTLCYLGVGEHTTKDNAAIVPHPIQHDILSKGQEAGAPRWVTCAREAYCLTVKVDGLGCVCVCAFASISFACKFPFSCLPFFFTNPVLQLRMVAKVASTRTDTQKTACLASTVDPALFSLSFFSCLSPLPSSPHAT